MSGEMTPTTTRLRELYDYNPATGRFVRRTGPKAGKLVRKSRAWILALVLNAKYGCSMT